MAPNRHTGVVDVAAGMVLVLLTSPLPTTLPAFKVELLQRPFLLLLAALFASFEKKKGHTAFKCYHLYDEHFQPDSSPTLHAAQVDHASSLSDQWFPESGLLAT